jgi:hypothetical protein
LLGAAGIAGALSKATQPSGPLLAGLLLFPTLGMAAAPYNSWAARRASLPPQLREQRHSEYHHERRAFAMGAATGGFITALCTATALAALMLTPHHLTYLPHSTGATPSNRPTPSSRPTPSHPAPDPGPRTSARPRHPSDLPSGLPSYLPTEIPTAVLSDLPSNLP